MTATDTATTTAETDQPELPPADQTVEDTADVAELVDSDAAGSTAEPARVARAIEAPEADRVASAMAEYHDGPTTERTELLPQLDRWAQMEAMARRLANAPTMPKHIRESRDGEADVMVILLAAHDLGLSATVALQKIHVIDGRPTQAAELMRMLIKRDGHDLWSEVQRDDDGKAVAVTWFGIRKDDPKERVHEATFSLADATLAKLLSKDNWQKYPEDMMSARATAKLARKAFEDCLAGVSYTPEELTIHAPSLDEPPPPAAPEPPMSPQHRAALRSRLDEMTVEEQDLVRSKWKDRKLGRLVGEADEPGKAILRISEMPAVLEIMDEARREAVAEAVLVPEVGPHPFEGSGTATECATCGWVRDHEVHTDACAGCLHPWDEHDPAPSEAEVRTGNDAGFGCNHLDVDPTDPDGEGVPCECGATRPTSGPPELGQTHVSADDQGEHREDSGGSAPISDLGATTAPAASEDPDPAGPEPDAPTLLLATQKVAKMNDRAVTDRLLSWRLGSFETVQTARKVLIEAMARRVMCLECGKLQTGAGRAEEPRCPCPF